MIITMVNLETITSLNITQKMTNKTEFYKQDLLLVVEEFYPHNTLPCLIKTTK